MTEAIALAALLALLLDALIGWPAAIHARLGHPVGLFAATIAASASHWNRDGKRGAGGIATVAILLLAAGGAGWLLQALIFRFTGNLAPVLLGLCAWPALAQRSLYCHVAAVVPHLQAGDLAATRQAVARIVGRDVAALDRDGVARAAIESLAESFADGVVAPLFWLLLAGLPGIWIYKAINTADSLIGYRNTEWQVFGRAAARLDDLLNFIPARLSAVLLCGAGGGGWQVLWRDAHKHASPNAGWPEAAMAGSLDLRLLGPAVYQGELQDKPWIGSGRTSVSHADIRRALRIYLCACGLLWLLAGGIAWLH